MPKDYAKRRINTRASYRKRKSKQPVFPWKYGLFTLLLIAIFIVVLIKLNHHQGAKKIVKTRSKQLIVKKPVVIKKQPQFDFYTILPRKEVDVSLLHKSKKLMTGYFLQVASVRTYAGADHLKAELSLLGFDTYIDKIKSGDDVVWIRVNIGPYSSYKAAQADQKRLAENHIKSILRKRK